MTRNLDDGDIFIQLPLTLEGSLEDIFERIIELGYKATIDIINNNYNLKNKMIVKLHTIKDFYRQIQK